MEREHLLAGLTAVLVGVGMWTILHFCTNETVFVNETARCEKEDQSSDDDSMVIIGRGGSISIMP
ncbi:hypothetical protein ACFL2R_03205 [Patescibacteria group bacterium]